ncbi:MAG: hypothetical protein CSB06_01650 [Bacteroidia bacterium]|nr:MAG: hypothetical protein CSB06_01650 [Bacteroidia bacterium]
MEGFNKQRLIFLIVAGIGVLAAFLPWMKVSVFGISQTASGMSNAIALLSFLAYIGVGVLAFLGDRKEVLEKKKKRIVLILGAVGALWSLFRMVQVMSEEMASVGIGCWLSLLAGLALIGACFFVNGKGEVKLPKED